MRSFLVDINVWVALAYDGHAHHERASRWFESSDLERAFFCRITQIGLLRLLTNRTVMGRDVLTQRQAWRIYDRLIRDERVGFLNEPSGVEKGFRDLTTRSLASSKQWPDAYLAAMARSAQMTLATFDASLANTAGLSAVYLG